MNHEPAFLLFSILYSDILEPNHIVVLFVVTIAIITGITISMTDCIYMIVLYL